MRSADAREHNVPMNEDFNRVRVQGDQDVSASWMVFHLIDHVWDHTVRIREIRNAFRR